MSKIIAVPSTDNNGLNSGISGHFGHCELYTLITVEDSKIIDTKTLKNVDHTEGGCLAPVAHLQKNGVNVMLAGGMGMRPLEYFNEMGIEVYHIGNADTVGSAVNGFISGNLDKFTSMFTCQGGHH